MITAAAFVVAAAAGALLRAGAARANGLGRHRPRWAWIPAGMPWGTMAVNLTGSFAYGLLVGWSPPGHTIAATGLLGTLTTFSTLSGEIHALWHDRRNVAVTYLATTVVVGVGLAWTGLQLAT